MADNIVLIGKKPAIKYVMACVSIMQKGSDTVIIKARGRAISLHTV